MAKFKNLAIGTTMGAMIGASSLSSSWTVGTSIVASALASSCSKPNEPEQNIDPIEVPGRKYPDDWIPGTIRTVKIWDYGPVRVSMNLWPNGMEARPDVNGFPASLVDDPVRYKEEVVPELEALGFPYAIWVQYGGDGVKRYPEIPGLGVINWSTEALDRWIAAIKKEMGIVGQQNPTNEEVVIGQ
ncbi:hypothetical protein FACS1894156_5860 [Bacteroidia bacterium]|nr:hypothetical protein FACS1894156_5860 [Bacteroidia bacterium]